MSKFTLLFVLSICGSSIAQSETSLEPCTHCTTIAEAMEYPSGVTHLDLHALGLGEIPKEINQFNNLKSLNLSENFIQEINFDTLRLLGLKELNLSKNPGFNTLALDGIAECSPSINSINFSNTNCISVSPEIVKCEELTSLNLSNNWIQFLPNKFGELDRLRSLDVSNNHLKMLPFLDGLWGLQSLDISENDDLHLNGIGASLLLKESLETLIISPDKALSKGLPNVFEVVNIEKLVIKNSSIDALNNRLSRNPMLKTVVLDNVKVQNPKRFVAWLNRMGNVNQIEYKNMEVHPKLDDIVSVGVMQFDNCTFTDRNELRKVKPRITMIAHGTDLHNGSYIGNAKIVDYEKSGITVSQDVIAMNDDMIDNTLEPIVEQSEQVNIIPADTPCEIKTENTSFEVPADAFLTASGEVYEGTVKAVVKEYMDPIENALTGMPMVNRTDDGRNEIFSSSGMLDFRAYDDNGVELKPNPANTIQVQMNDLQPSESPNFYSFNEETKNWDDDLPPASSRLARRKSLVLDSLNKVLAAQITGFQHVPILLGMNYKKSRKDPYQLTFSVDQGRKMPLKKIRDFQPVVYTANADQRWIARRNTWKIDTILTDDMKFLLKDVKKDLRRVSRKWGDEPGAGNFTIPRVIKDLTLTPNLEDDNYILTFVYQDTVRRLPVISSFGGSIRRIQTKEKANYKSFKIAQKTALKEKALIEKYENTILEEYAQAVRIRRAQALAEFPDYESANREYLRFGLTSFGLVNCDYFSRNIPDTYVAFDSVGVDEDGHDVNIPYDVRNVYVDDNVFVATTSDKVPVFNGKRSIIFFLITSTEIAIVKGWEKLKNGFSKPKVERVKIDRTDSPAQIRGKILATEP
ncbi:MAG: leucine-rich repeat domain-containing protein [Crocinitomicaceae bacterium]|nr:leucine-rich repeat domain-containing protein [Crocinitomicaceae bacterium]